MMYLFTSFPIYEILKNSYSFHWNCFPFGHHLNVLGRFATQAQPHDPFPTLPLQRASSWSSPPCWRGEKLRANETVVECDASPHVWRMCCWQHGLMWQHEPQSVTSRVPVRLFDAGKPIHWGYTLDLILRWSTILSLNITAAERRIKAKKESVSVNLSISLEGGWDVRGRGGDIWESIQGRDKFSS